MKNEAPLTLTASERRALCDAGIDLAGPPDDPSGDEQVALGLQRIRAMYEGSLSVPDAATRLGVAPEEIEAHIAATSVATIDGPDGSRLCEWQFDAGSLVPGVGEVVRAAGHIHPLSLATFMSRPNEDLECGGYRLSPLEWLKRGRDTRVVANLAFGLTFAG